ncbi:hypothetical protein [Nonomuraea typhae]|uniref:hypothetical protein n=1 Tax=Nonomuraea typhae TaxID=2603600 RepID=UPI001CA5728E|nr:hypothetical protein [Nonomuraea typhae]
MHTTTKRRTLAGAAVSLITAATVLATAPPASAEPSPPGCPKGYFCAWEPGSPPWTGRVVLKTWGNWSGNVTTGSLFNNGIPQPGADHVQVNYDRFGTTWSECLHYNPGPGTYKLDFGVAYAEITSVTWRGEC